MSEQAELHDLAGLVDRIREGAEDGEEVSLEHLMDKVGRRSFGPLLLLIGLIALSPLSGIPLIPTTLGVMVILISGQLLVRRKCLWLPQWALSRTIKRSKIEKAAKFLRRPARFVDRLIRPRLTWLTEGAATYGIAVMCILIAATMPPLELLPFMASTAGAALSAYGLALIAHDGLLALIAFVLTAVAGWAVVTQVIL